MFSYKLPGHTFSRSYGINLPSEQSEAVKKALASMGVNTPEQLSGNMGRDISPNYPATSAAYNSAGIKGIKYLDAGSRSAGEGSRNYVVFDDQIIDILRKFGLLPPLAATAAASQLKKDQP